MFVMSLPSRPLLFLPSSPLSLLFYGRGIPPCGLKVTVMQYSQYSLI